MSRFFSCVKGCTECCEDVRFSIELSLEDMVNMSEHRGITVVQLFDEAMAAVFAPEMCGDFYEIKAFLKMPCQYIGETEPGVKGCSIHEYKPLVCDVAPRDRVIPGIVSDKWDFGCLKPITKKEKKAVLRKVHHGFIQLRMTDFILYRPKILAPENLLEKNPEFRKIAETDYTNNEIVSAANRIVDSIYRQSVRERFEMFQDDFQKYGSIGDVLDSRQSW